MTGAQIAENLRNSKLPHGRYIFFDTVGKTYCALGIKMSEAGMSDEDIKRFQSLLYLADCCFTGLRFSTALTSLNDTTASKRELIRTLDNPRYRKVEFPVEKFIKSAKLYLERYRGQSI